MKKISLLIIILFLAVSCAPQKEILRPPEVRPQVIAETPSPAATVPAVAAPAVKYQSFLQCDEKTKDFYNSSGIEVLPFIRVVFYDIDADGVNEMIAGSKDGTLRLYRNAGSRISPDWRLDEDYFSGVSAGAFSAPAAGDIDGDGIPEILVGTGGFSKDSGKVICFKNSGTSLSPVWKKMDLTDIGVGNDATPALFDVDNDGMTDLIVGNSTGRLFLFRARRTGKGVTFVKDTSYFQGINLGMYAVPTVTSHQGKIVIIAGNSMGKLSILERGYDTRSLWKKSELRLSCSNFAAPAFIHSDRTVEMDLVLSDGGGQLSYYRNSRSNYRDWDRTDDFFSGRILPGAASSPVITELDGNAVMVVGNINGEIRLFVNEKSAAGLPWRERPEFFSGIKLSSFSRGVLTDWEGRPLLITGQQDGIIRAFINTGSFDRPSWVEEKFFFRGVPGISHAVPTVFDIDGDGKWELIVGGSDGYVSGYRYETGHDGNPLWQKIEKIFEYAKVARFASPSLVKDQDKTYLFVGQQDGKIDIFTADPMYWGNSVFYPDEYIQGVQVKNHSSPGAIEKKGFFELAVGDYDGNLKYFTCHSEKREIKDN
jgi:hypothetical protein